MSHHTTTAPAQVAGAVVEPLAQVEGIEVGLTISEETPLASVFDSADLALLPKMTGEIGVIAEKLTSFVLTPGHGQGMRFLFSSHSEDVALDMAALRLCRRALDFLDDDFDEALNDQMSHYRHELEACGQLLARDSVLRTGEGMEGEDELEETTAPVIGIPAKPARPTYADASFVAPRIWDTGAGRGWLSESTEETAARLKQEAQVWGEFLPKGRIKVRTYRVFRLDQGDPDNEEYIAKIQTSIPLLANDWALIFKRYIEEHHPHIFQSYEYNTEGWMLWGNELHQSPQYAPIFAEMLFSMPLLFKAYAWCFSRWNEIGDEVLDDETLFM